MRHVLTLFAVLFCSLASADDVPPPPTDCPPGSVGRTNHGGPHCAPSVCQSDTECKDGKVCQELALCITEDTYTTGRMPNETPRKRSSVNGACDEKKSCTLAATCQTAKYCAPKVAAKSPEPTKAETTKGTSCATSPAESAPLSLLFCLLVLGLWVRASKRE